MEDQWVGGPGKHFKNIISLCKLLQCSVVRATIKVYLICSEGI